MSSASTTNGVCSSATGANWSAYSLQGKARERNADAFATFDSDGWQAFAVADGVGSLPASPVASRAAVEAVIEAIRSGALSSADSLTSVLSDVDIAVGNALAECEAKGATTLGFVAIKDSGVLGISVGDSEIHLVESAGPSILLHPLDHVPAQRNILLAWIDGEAVYEPHVVAMTLENARLCLMSDGIPGSLSPEDIATTVRSASPEDAARKLVLAARDAGAGDDLTAVVVAVELQAGMK